jgi:serine protease Do
MKQINKLWVALMVFSLLVFPALGKISYAAVQMVPESFSELARQAKPAVVNIQTEKTLEGGGRVYRHFFGSPFGGNQDMFEEFFGPFLQQQPRNRKESSLGSGFIITEDGYIVTNNHVIKDADQIKVILHDNKEYEATVVGTDPMTDLALIKIEAKDLMALKFGSSSKADVGSWVVAIGSPFGLEQTVTAGIVSAKGRIIGSGPYDDFIQTDASINPGNSGGPLLNLDGEVIGINTAIVRSGQGIGFAIPSDLATGIIAQLTQDKTVSRGWMGVAIQEVTQQLAEYYGLKDIKGVFVAKVFEGEPAEKAGIQVGDVIYQINDKPVNSSRDLTFTVAGIAVGDTINVKLIREGKEKTIKVKLGKRPADDPNIQAQNEDYDVFGLKLKPLDADLAGKLGYPETLKGLVLMDIQQGSKASASILRPGDLLLEINRHKINTLEQYQQYLKKLNKGETVQLLFRRGNSQVFVISVQKP